MLKGLRRLLLSYRHTSLEEDGGPGLSDVSMAMLFAVVQYNCHQSEDIRMTQRDTTPEIRKYVDRIWNDASLEYTVNKPNTLNKVGEGLPTSWRKAERGRMTESEKKDSGPCKCPLVFSYPGFPGPLNP